MPLLNYRVRVAAEFLRVDQSRYGETAMGTFVFVTRVVNSKLCQSICGVTI